MPSEPAPQVLVMPRSNAVSRPAEVRAAAPQDTDEIIRLLDGIWSFQDNAAWLGSDPGYQPHQTRVFVADDRIVTVLQVFSRPMRVGHDVRKVGCIGNVATLPDYRGRGHATRLLEDAIAYMEREGYDLSMLFTGVPPLYEKLGWKAMPQSIVSFRIREDVDLPYDSDGRIGDWERDLAGVMRVYDEFNRGRTGTVVRTDDCWRAQLRWLREEDPAGFLVAERGGEIVAYTRCRKDANFIMEYGYLPGWEDAMTSLFVQLAWTFRARHDGRIIAYSPRDPLAERLLAESCVDVNWSVPPLQTPHIEHVLFRPIRWHSLDRLAGYVFWYSDHF
ncbi:MAG: GNAT family N-acetyltransferase [Planctomycetes bacterium]|nr:GNAT family N-acetyltransferase [Planctomycetota bacterium]